MYLDPAYSCNDTLRIPGTSCISAAVIWVKKMKVRYLLVLSGLLAVFSDAAQEEYRMFKDAEGRTIEAVLIRYNQPDKTVTIRPRKRSATTVPINMFSKEDQTYIIKESQRRAMLDTKQLSIDVNHIEKFDRDNVLRDDFGEQRRFYHFYSITMENKSSIDLDVSLEYVIFYRQEKHVYGEEWRMQEKEGTLYRMVPISIPHKSGREYATHPVLLTQYRVDGNNDPATTPKADIDGDPEGIMIRISMKTADGEILMREVSYPDDLDRTWTSRTLNAQVR